MITQARATPNPTLTPTPTPNPTQWAGLSSATSGDAGDEALARRALYLPYISPVSPLHLPCLSLPLACTSPISRLRLACISPAPPLHLPRCATRCLRCWSRPISPLYLPYISPISRQVRDKMLEMQAETTRRRALTVLQPYP